MKELKTEDLISLIETAEIQLTADYACYFGIRDAEIMIELARKAIPRRIVNAGPDGWRCPDCGCEPAGGKYCDECGQRIDS